MGLNAAIAVTGIAKQVAKGTAIAEPTFAHGVTGGNVVSAEISQKPVETTSAYREPLFVNRDSIAAGTDPKFLAFSRSLGLWLLAAFGSVQTTDLTGGRYRHVFSVGSDLGWFTLFGQYGGAHYFALPDAKVDKFGFSWKGNDPCEASVTALSGAIDLAHGALSPGTDDSLGDFLRPLGGTFELDAGGTTLAATLMTGGGFEVNNALDAVVASGSIIPGAINPKAMDPAVKLSVMPDDLAIWRTVLTGTPTGTDMSETTVYGSFSTKFLAGAADNLIVKGQKVPFACKFPDADPKGGTAEVELEATPVKKDASTPSIEFILENGVVSY